MSQNTKPKVLLVGPSGPHVAAHIELISACAGEIVLITNRPSVGADRCRVEVTNFGLKSAANWLKTPNFIKAEIEAFQPDVIHVHQANSYAFYTHMANRKTRVPIVLTLWGSDVLVLPERSKLFKAMVRYNLRHANRLTADAQFLADRAEALTKCSLPIKICNFGVNPSELKLPKENIIYSNRNHEPLYRIDAIIQMFKQFINAQNGEQWRLVIAGRGSQTDQLKQLTNELDLQNYVDFVGFLSRDDNEQWYARARVFASLPTSDATAISLLEAMYHGCIPVVTDLPANREWITDRSNGIVVHDVNNDFFSHALDLDAVALAKHNRALIEKNGLKSVASHRFCEVLLETASLSSGRVGRKD